MKKTFVRLLVIIPVIAIQALWLVLLIRWLSPYSAVINFILTIFAVFFVLYIITKRDESTYKILWLLIILTMPLAGVPKYSRSLRTATHVCLRRWAGCKGKRAARF